MDPPPRPDSTFQKLHQLAGSIKDSEPQPASDIRKALLRLTQQEWKKLETTTTQDTKDPDRRSQFTYATLIFGELKTWRTGKDHTGKSVTNVSSKYLHRWSELIEPPDLQPLSYLYKLEVLLKEMEVCPFNRDLSTAD